MALKRSCPHFSKRVVMASIRLSDTLAPEAGRRSRDRALRGWSPTDPGRSGGRWRVDLPAYVGQGDLLTFSGGEHPSFSCEKPL